MERALLQGERESEAARLRQEQEAAQQLQEKLSSLDASIRKERDKVSPGAGLPPRRRLCRAMPSPVLAAGAAVLRRSPADTFSCPWALRRHRGASPLGSRHGGDLSACLPWGWSNSPARGG